MVGLLEFYTAARNSARALTSLFLRLALALILSMGAAPSPAQAGLELSEADLTRILRLVRHYEAGGDYNTVYQGLERRPPRPLTAMTIEEVIAWQRSLGRVRSTASGAYQFIRSTLEETAARSGLPLSTRFSENTQDYLAGLLVQGCAEDSNNNTQMANCLAGVWAALPLVSGPNQGRSRYEGIAGNRALTTPEVVLAVLGGEDVALPNARPITVAGSLTQDGQVTEYRAVLPGAVRITLIREQMRIARETGEQPRSIYYAVDPYAGQ